MPESHLSLRCCLSGGGGLGDLSEIGYLKGLPCFTGVVSRSDFGLIGLILPASADF